MSAARRIDWADLLERTRRAEQAVLEAGTISPEQRERILRERADSLLAPIHLRREADATFTVVIVRCGAERYALPLQELREVIRQPKMTRVPHAPAIVAGLIQVRGEIRPVYHLQVLLGRATSAAPGTVLLVTTGAAEFDAVIEKLSAMRRAVS